jgi:hypothetical protein
LKSDMMREMSTIAFTRHNTCMYIYVWCLNFPLLSQLALYLHVQHTFPMVFRRRKKTVYSAFPIYHLLIWVPNLLCVVGIRIF